MLSIILIVVLILFLSSLIRSIFGFGDALIAMPLLTMIISAQVAAPIVAFISSIIAISILIYNFKQIKFMSIWQLIFFSAIGIPIGLYFLSGASDIIVKILLALVLIIFSIYKLINPNLLVLKDERYSWIAGLIAGLLGGAYNTNGPPIIIYGTMRQWKPIEFRAILQGIFFPTNLIIIIGHGIAGNWTSEVITLTLYSLPLVIIGIVIGSKINKKINSEKFQKYIYYLLILIAVVMLLTL